MSEEQKPPETPPPQFPGLLDQRELDRRIGNGPGFGPMGTLFPFTARCHPNAGFVAAYDKALGVLHIQCRQCQASAGVFRIAYHDPWTN